MKTKESPRGISRQGLDSAFEADERRKSNLLLTARSLREEGKSEESANTFAEVAERVQSDVENRAMDRFIGQLKQKYRDAIIIDEQALNDLR